MSDALLSDHGSTTLSANVEAVLVWSPGVLAPGLSLSFDGLDQPIALLRELAEIGWRVPPAPSRPHTAIEWVPDPVAGTDHTIHPWRVNDFKLGRGEWAGDGVASVVGRSFQALQRHAAHIDATPELIAQLAGQAPAAAAPTTAGSSGPSHPPQVILIGYQGPSNSSIRQTSAVTKGRERIAIDWAESIHDASSVCPTDEARQAMASDSIHAWEVRYSDQPVMPSGQGQAQLCAAVPGTPAGQKKLNKIVGMLGGSVQVASLVPLDGKGDEAALVFGVLPAKDVELAATTLRLRFGASIVRTEKS